MNLDDALRILRREPRHAGAWEVIALDVYQPLLAYVASLLLTFKVGPSETARDIVQEALLKFYERWSRGGAEVTSAQALHAYLRTSCRNLLIDRYRRERHAEQFIDFLSLKFSGAFQGESALYKSIFLDEIINKLPDDCADIFRVYISEDLTLAEIAERFKEVPSSFYTRWYRCLEQAKVIFNSRSEQK